MGEIGEIRGIGGIGEIGGIEVVGIGREVVACTPVFQPALNLPFNLH